MFNKRYLTDKKVKISIVILLISILFLSYYIFFNPYGEVDALSKYGSTGDEVKQIQTKLKRWGYYDGEINGIYDNETIEAVKYFQRKNGLPEDGVCRN